MLPEQESALDQDSPSALTGVHPAPRSSSQLPRTLSPLETWGFGLTGHIGGWLSTAPVLHAALGAQAFWVWLPATLAGMLLNYQVKRYGQHFPNLAGGTPNYTTHLWQQYPALGRYAAAGYLSSWICGLVLNTLVLTSAIKGNLTLLGITFPEELLKLGFIALPFIVAFSGTRALGILHLFFIIPASGLLFTFCTQGLTWLAFSPASPGFFPDSWPSFSIVEWAKWFFFATYITYACETASSFIADSRRPKETLRFLGVAAWLMLPVFLGGSWVVMRLVSTASDDAALDLTNAATHFWGSSASFLITFLLTSGLLLSSTTIVSNCPRILYQLALDGHISPVFGVVSRRGVFGPALSFTLLLTGICLLWGNINQILVIGATGYFISIMAVHLGLWICRDRPEVLAPRIAFGLFWAEVVILIIIAVWGWGWQDLGIGFLSPLVILAIDGGLRRSHFFLWRPKWWLKQYRTRSQNQLSDFIAFQVTALIVLSCSTLAIGWIVRDRLSSNAATSSNLLGVLLLMVALIGVALACWTSLPQVFSLDEAREAAEQLFEIAIDAILVLDVTGTIRQVNPATEHLFGLSRPQLIGQRLSEFLAHLPESPYQWASRSEQILERPDRNPLILEVAISDRFSQKASQLNRDLQEYVVILRDITIAKQAEVELQKANEALETRVEQRTAQLQDTVAQLQQEITERQRIEANLRAMQDQIIMQEKLASLGNLTAGIAHEIRNPLNFINNFSELSVEIVQELNEVLAPHQEQLNPNTQDELVDLLDNLTQNLEKINHHGQRADRIVTNMLLHSRSNKGQWELTDLNKLVTEYVNLAYHGVRAKNPAFTIDINTEYDPDIGEVEVIPQDISRVFLNIINNACYAAYKKKQELGETVLPQLWVKTQNLEQQVEIRIRDNGSGMTPEVVEKIFNPFFTTKPAGEGTGLGLSISYDIVVQQHRGEIYVETELGSYTEFIVLLPKHQGKAGGKDEASHGR